MSHTSSSPPPGAFRQKLLDRAQRMTAADLARRMGYRRISDQVLARLNGVLRDDALGLQSARIDLRYTSHGFYDALCNALSIDPTERDAERKRLQKIALRRKTLFKPYLFVDTGFRPGRLPMFGLAFIENTRRLMFETAFRDLSLDEQIPQISERVREHFAQTGGVLRVWGPIQRYLFRHGQHDALIFDTDGQPGGETDWIEPTHANSVSSAKPETPPETRNKTQNGSG